MTKLSDSNKDSARLLMEELEPRILLSADLDGVFADHVVTADSAGSMVDSPLVTDEAGESGVPSAAEPRRELIIIDPATPDFQILVTDLINNADDGRQFEIAILDADTDGVVQLNALFTEYSDLDAVHLISHGSDGRIGLGAGDFSLDDLLTSAQDVQAWGDAFTEDGDLLIYGCNLAAGADGQMLIDVLGRLTGTDVAASDDLTGDSERGGDWDLEYQVGKVETGVALSAQAQANWSGVLNDGPSLLIGTKSDVGSPSGAPGLDSWTAGEALQFSDPNLALEPGTTNGTFSSLINFDSFAADLDMQMTGLHYVSSDITVGGANAIDLRAGDLLLSVRAAETLTSTNSLTVSAGDVFVFRPDNPGDYSSGTFTMLLENPFASNIQSISLVEQDTLVGDVVLQAGTFLYSRPGGSFRDNIYMYVADDVGAGTTSGTSSVLLDGADIGISASVLGVDVIEEATTIGGAILQVGTILVTIGSESTVGDNALSVTRQDIFTLDVTMTSRFGTAQADATLLFEGADVNFNANGEDIQALSFFHDQAPGLDLDVDDSSGALSADFNTIFAPGGGPIAITDVDATVIDNDSATLDSITITITNLLDGANEILSADTTGTLITASYVGAVLTLSGTDSVANYQQVLRTIAYDNTSLTPDPADRLITFVASDGIHTGNIAVTTVSAADTNPPTVGVNTGSTVLEGGTDPIPNTELRYADSEQGAGSVTYLRAGCGQCDVHDHRSGG